MSDTLILAADSDEGIEDFNLQLVGLLQETENRRTPNYFTTLTKFSKYVKDCAEAENLIQEPIFQAVPERRALVRKSDGKIFGLQWLQNLFDELVARLSDLLRLIYRGNIWEPLPMSWTKDRYGRKVLASDALALSYLSRVWEIGAATVETAKEFARLVAK